MTSRAAGLLVVLCAVVVLGASVSTWAVVTMTEDFAETAEDESFIIERTDEVNGTELAGELVGVALAGIVAGGLMIRFRIGWTAVALGVVGLGLVAVGWPDEGEATAAPYAAALGLVGMIVLAVLSLRAATAADPVAGDDEMAEGGGAAVPARSDGPSRYTVEAVEEQHSDDAEWDLASVEDGDDTDLDQTAPDPNRTERG